MSLASLDVSASTGVLLIAAVVAFVLVAVYASALGTIVLGGAVILLAAIILYYVLVRLDSVLRHGRIRR